MAKKKSKGSVGLSLILSIVSIALAVLTFVSLAFNFLSAKTEVLGVTKTTNYNLAGWMDRINFYKDAEGVVGWNVGKVFMIITLVVVGLLAVALLVNLFVKNKYLTLAIKVLSVLTVVVALVFFISTLVGCGKLSNDATTYIANFAVYAIAITSLASAVVGFFAVRK